MLLRLIGPLASTLSLWRTMASPEMISPLPSNAVCAHAIGHFLFLLGSFCEGIQFSGAINGLFSTTGKLEETQFVFQSSSGQTLTFSSGNRVWIFKSEAGQQLFLSSNFSPLTGEGSWTDLFGGSVDINGICQLPGPPEEAGACVSRVDVSTQPAPQTQTLPPCVIDTNAGETLCKHATTDFRSSV